VNGALKSTRFCLYLKWIFIGLAVSVIFSPFFLAHAGEGWRAIAPGIEYQDRENFLTPWSHLHLFRIQLDKNELSLGKASDLGLKQAFVNDLAKHAHAQIAINGGFFDRLFSPLGLRVNQGQQSNALKNISWWGVFYVENGKPHIKRAGQFLALKPQADFAIQSGPRLIIKGRIPTLKPGKDERTALGITQSGELIILVTENAALTTTELAKVMLEEPISAVDAINLDGGSSTQIYVNLPKLQLDIHGFSMVADAILVRLS
jgi:uncharacterized protein YigE (DUF2233 family)